MSVTNRRVAVVPGDDAAPEAMAATMHALERMRLPIDWTVLEPGQPLATELADAMDSVLFGASSGATVALTHLRYGWGTFANVRPIRYIPGTTSALRNPEKIDFVIIREALEDVYVGIEGPLDKLTEETIDLTTMVERRGTVLRYPFAGARDGVYGVKIFTREGVERVARFAAEFAAERKRRGYPGRVTIGGKWNVNPVTDGFFRSVATEIIEQVPGLTCDSYLGDDFGRRMVMHPHEFDVVLLPNLLGDLLSDVAAGTIGGLGMAPSGGYGEERAYFEPIHGSAPDIAGKNIINPTATMLSAAMMFDYLGLREAAHTLDSAVRGVIAEGRCLTPDLGGTASTHDFGRAVAERCY